MTHPSTVADTLDAAADLLSKPGAWTQGEYARDAKGHKVSPVSKAREPVCFCLLGAVMHAQGSGRHDTKAIQFISRRSRGVGPWQWNDATGRTQDEVVAKLREAAAKARGEVQP